MVRSGKGKRPEAMQPPQEELAKLRKVTESPEDQYRRGRRPWPRPWMSFWLNTGRLLQAQPDHAPNRRRRGDQGRNAERAERALEAEVERRRKKPATGPATIAMARASSPFPGDRAPGPGGRGGGGTLSGGGVRRRHRNSRSRNRSNPIPTRKSPTGPNLGRRERAVLTGIKKATERVVEEPRPLRAEFLPTSSVWKAIRPLCAGWLLSMEVYSLANPIFQSRIAPLPPAGQGPGHAGLPGQCGGESRPLRGKTSGGVFAHSGP